nr:MAG TPA: hypothetical protein [Caudoviricetes sp.]
MGSNPNLGNRWMGSTRKKNTIFSHVTPLPLYKKRKR